MVGVASVGNLYLVRFTGRDEPEGVATHIYIGYLDRDFGMWQPTHSLPGDPGWWWVWFSTEAPRGPFGEFGPWQLRQMALAGFMRSAL